MARIAGKKQAKTTQELNSYRFGAVQDHDQQALRRKFVFGGASASRAAIPPDTETQDYDILASPGRAASSLGGVARSQRFESSVH